MAGASVVGWKENCCVFRFSALEISGWAWTWSCCWFGSFQSRSGFRYEGEEKVVGSCVLLLPLHLQTAADEVCWSIKYHFFINHVFLYFFSLTFLFLKFRNLPQFTEILSKNVFLGITRTTIDFLLNNFLKMIRCSKCSRLPSHLLSCLSRFYSKRWRTSRRSTWSAANSSTVWHQNPLLTPIRRSPQVPRVLSRVRTQKNMDLLRKTLLLLKKTAWCSYFDHISWFI